MDVTPPRPMKACYFAVRAGRPRRPNYCRPDFCELTRRNSWSDAAWHDRPCAPCERRELKQRLDEDWHSFLRRNFRRLTEPEITFYQNQREQIFENYYWDWGQLHANIMNNIRQDIQAKYGSGSHQ
ncbi:hypothetical protein F5Y13DRAFT_187542 [Hypoxylon sp. FL1857]|nr:hypothetical protein F5Y13DRAFT_187542 [Hypoxylon sp. FL1857]